MGPFWGGGGGAWERKKGRMNVGSSDVDVVTRKKHCDVKGNASVGD
jgi:hypothetical protein